MTAPALNQFEERLEREGLAPLDGPGQRLIDNRGSGKIHRSGNNDGNFANRSQAAEEIEQRGVISRTRRFRRGERRIAQMYALGMSTRVIAFRVKRGRMAVFRVIQRLKRQRPPEHRLGTLLAACEPTTIVLIFALLERALTAPETVRDLIGKARAVPEIRQLIDPDEVRDG